MLNELANHGVLYPTAVFMTTLAAAKIAAGRIGEVEDVLRRTREMGTKLQNLAPGAQADVIQGVLERARGRPDLADDLCACRRTGRSWRRACDPTRWTDLEVLAGCLVDLGNAPDALRLLAAADATRYGESGGAPADSRTLSACRRPRTSRRQSSRSVTVRTSCRAEGSRLSLDEAVAFAMRSRGTRRRPSTGWASLTPTELQVVELVDGGHVQPRDRGNAADVPRDREDARLTRALETRHDVASRARGRGGASRRDGTDLKTRSGVTYFE